jgi:hypothetical protein
MNRPEVQNKQRGDKHAGIRKVIKANKRKEAAARNAETHPSQRRSFAKQNGHTRVSEMINCGRDEHYAPYRA